MRGGMTSTNIISERSGASADVQQAEVKSSDKTLEPTALRGSFA
jgi:hypothetical protein